VQRKGSNYDTDLFTPPLKRIGEISGHTYRGTHETASDVDASSRTISARRRS
jgi:hypothetical protein